MERMVHASIQTTATTYAHVTPGISWRISANRAASLFSLGITGIHLASFSNGGEVGGVPKRKKDLGIST